MEQMMRSGHTYLNPMSYLIDVSREESQQCVYSLAPDEPIDAVRQFICRLIEEYHPIGVVVYFACKIPNRPSNEHIVCFACFVPDAEQPLALRAFYIDEKDIYIDEYPDEDAWAFFARTPATFRQNPYFRREGDPDPQETPEEATI